MNSNIVFVFFGSVNFDNGIFWRVVVFIIMNEFVVIFFIIFFFICFVIVFVLEDVII